MPHNPFQAEIDATLQSAELKKQEALNAPNGQHVVPWEEYKRLTAKAETLIDLGLEWQQNRLQTTVTALEKMARDETARQSSIGGRLTELANRVRGEIGLGPMSSGGQTSGAGAAVTAVESLISHATRPSGGGQPPIMTPPAVMPPVMAPPVVTPPPAVVASASAVDPSRRDVDLDKLHPEMNKRVKSLLKELKQADVPMKVFEAFRPPERQALLYAQGRTAPGNKVTNAEPWSSFHQYGLAVDMVIDKAGFGMWDESAQGNQWWDAYHELARKSGLEPISWEKPHIQMTDLSFQSLKAGEYPPGDGGTWAQNLSEAILRWPGPNKPKPPGDDQDRPPLRVAPARSVSVRDRLPPKPVFDWMSLHGGQEWRVDGDGVYLRSVNGGMTPIRSSGSPLTATTILHLFGDALADAAIRFKVAPELLLMILATESGGFRRQNFTGPDTFRWESKITDYSAGPMQILGATARDVNHTEGLGLDEDRIPKMSRKPAKPPEDLLLYEGAPAITIGAAFIRRNGHRLGLTDNPILVSASYNAGSVRTSTGNLWRIRVHGNHLDRAAEWYGDACFVCAEHLR